MKIKYANKTEQEFTPYEVTFLIENKEEARWFHDHVAIKATKSHGHIGEAYHRIHHNDDRRVDKIFTITPEERRYPE